MAVEESVSNLEDLKLIEELKQHNDVLKAKVQELDETLGVLNKENSKNAMFALLLKPLKPVLREIKIPYGIKVEELLEYIMPVYPAHVCASVCHISSQKIGKYAEDLSLFRSRFLGQRALRVSKNKEQVKKHETTILLSLIGLYQIVVELRKKQDKEFKIKKDKYVSKVKALNDSKDKGGDDKVKKLYKLVSNNHKRSLEILSE